MLLSWEIFVRKFKMAYCCFLASWGECYDGFGILRPRRALRVALTNGDRIKGSGKKTKGVHPWWCVKTWITKNNRNHLFAIPIGFACHQSNPWSSRYKQKTVNLITPTWNKPQQLTQPTEEIAGITSRLFTAPPDKRGHETEVRKAIPNLWLAS